MVRPTVVAEEKLFSYLLELGKIDGFVPGLILGQCSPQKDYVVHFARTPLPDSCRTNEGVEDSMPSGDNLTVDVTKIKLFTDVEESWLRAHAREVTRMLPGGMWILGIFIVGPEDVFANRNYANKVSSLVAHVNNSLKSNAHLNGQNPKKSQLVLVFNSQSQKYICKAYDSDNLNMAVKPVDWKFQPNPTEWYSIDCCYNLSKIPPLYISRDKAQSSLKSRLKDILVNVSENVEKAVCTIDGQFREMTDTLSVLKKHQKKDKDKEKKQEEKVKSFKANLYVLQEAKDEDEKIKVELMESVCDMECNGHLSSQVYLHQKATVEEAIKAVKEDIVRSWAARLEMHWDSYIEEPKSGKDKKAMHIPPLRVICPLPYCPVSISEYVFPDEEINEASHSIEEQLGFRVSREDINHNFERQPNGSKKQAVHFREGNGRGDHEGGNSGRHKISNRMIIGLIIAILVLVLSIVVQFSSSKKTENR